MNSEPSLALLRRAGNQVDESLLDLDESISNALQKLAAQHPELPPIFPIAPAHRPCNFGMPFCRILRRGRLALEPTSRSQRLGGHRDQDAQDWAQAAPSGRRALVVSVHLARQYAGQGSCAEVTKLGRIDIGEKLKGRAHLVSCVHDEIIVECDEAEAVAVMAEVQKIMMAPSAQIFNGQTIRVEAHILDNWAGVKMPIRSTELILAS